MPMMCITSKAIMFRHTSSRLYGVGLKSRSGTASRSRSGSGCSDEKSGVDVVDSRNSSFSSFSKVGCLFVTMLSAVMMVVLVMMVVFIAVVFCFWLSKKEAN